MKNGFITFLFGVLTGIVIALFVTMKVSAKEPDFRLMNATCYTASETAKMANGDKVHDGACAVAPEIPFGAVILMYQAISNGDSYEVGEYLGIVEVTDRGGAKGLREGGASIDVFFYSEGEMQAFINRTYEKEAKGKVLAQIITDAKG